MLADQITAPYSALESWAYDRWIAPAVSDQWEVLAADLTAIPEGARVLDVGCGGGQNLMLVAEHRPDLRLTGLDLSAHQVRRARKRAAAHGSRARFVEGSALDLPLADEMFDMVVSIASIKHWPDRRRGVAECVRVLAPGGRLLIVEADRSCHLDDVRRFVGRWPVPRPVQRIWVPLFRTYVAGQAIDLDDARELLRDQPLAQWEVQRISGFPALVMRARKAD